MSIDYTAANAYFSTTVRGQTWSDFTEEQRTAAIAQAKRELTSINGATLTTDTTEDGDHPRQDCAVYEYAYTLLINSPAVGSGGEQSPDELFSDIDSGRERSPVLNWRVLRFMGIEPRISRG